MSASESVELEFTGTVGTLATRVPNEVVDIVRSAVLRYAQGSLVIPTHAKVSEWSVAIRPYNDTVVVRATVDVRRLEEVQGMATMWSEFWLVTFALVPIIDEATGVEFRTSDVAVSVWADGAWAEAAVYATKRRVAIPKWAGTNGVWPTPIRASAYVGSILT